jgi:hypothetical protein
MINVVLKSSHSGVLKVDHTRESRLGIDGTLQCILPLEIADHQMTIQRLHSAEVLTKNELLHFLKQGQQRKPTPPLAASYLHEAFLVSMDLYQILRRDCPS